MLAPLSGSRLIGKRHSLSLTFVLKQLVKEEITQTNRKADSSFATVFFSCRFVTTLVLRDFIYFRKRRLEENSSSSESYLNSSTFEMTASIFVGGKPIDGKLILSDDWRKVCRNLFVLFLCLFEFDSFELPFRLSGVIHSSLSASAFPNFCP